MKKNKILLTVVFAMISTITFAQFIMTPNTTTEKGTLGIGKIQINAGFGFSGWGTPIFVGLDYGVTNEITVGGEISYRSISSNNVEYTATGFFANANYHFNKALQLPPEFDVYGGVSLGYYNWNVDSDYIVNAEYSSDIGYAIQVGGRYFFTDRLGLNLEFGTGSTSGGKLGITYRFH